MGQRYTRFMYSSAEMSMKIYGSKKKRYSTINNRCCFHCRKMRLLKPELRSNSSGLLFLKERCEPTLEADSAQINLNSNLRRKFLPWFDKQMLKTRFFAKGIARRCQVSSGEV